jgi:hypothetical protein
VLIKGSRANRLERVSAALAASPQGQAMALEKNKRCSVLLYLTQNSRHSKGRFVSSII